MRQGEYVIEDAHANQNDWEKMGAQPIASVRDLGGYDNGNVMLDILHEMRRYRRENETNKEQDKLMEEWRCVSICLDEIFFWIMSAAAVGGTGVTLCVMPLMQ